MSLLVANISLMSWGSLKVRDVQKTEIWFVFGFQKKRTIQKSEICSDGFLIETACNPSFK